MEKFYYCPRCGKKLTESVVEDIPRDFCGSCGYMHYVNSKPCVAVLVEDNNRLMLTRRAADPFKGMWDLPGGFLEDAEHPEDGARREIMEETGLEIKISALLGIHMDIYGPEGVSTLNFHYLARPVAGRETPASDVAEIGWFKKENMPEEIAFENCKKAVQRWIYIKKKKNEAVY